MKKDVCWPGKQFLAVYGIENAICSKDITISKDGNSFIKNAILKRDALISDLKDNISSIAAEKGNLNSQLTAIYSSNFWKVSSAYCRLRDNNLFLSFIYKITRKLKSKLKRGTN
jgi:hypothetical protein